MCDEEAPRRDADGERGDSNGNGNGSGSMHAHEEVFDPIFGKSMMEEMFTENDILVGEKTVRMRQFDGIGSGGLVYDAGIALLNFLVGENKRAANHQGTGQGQGEGKGKGEGEGKGAFPLDGKRLPL